MTAIYLEEFAGIINLQDLLEVNINNLAAILHFIWSFRTCNFY